MAVALVKNLGTGSSKTAASPRTITIPAAGVAAGNTVFVFWGCNDASLAKPSSVTDTAGNTYVLDKGTASVGGSADAQQVWRSNIATALVSGNTISVSGQSTSAGVTWWTAEEFSGVASGAPTASAENVSTSPTAPTLAATPTAAGSLVVGGLSLNGPTEDTFTQDSDTLEGSWVSLTSAGTTGGAQTSNETGRPGFKVVSGTSAQTWNPTTGTLRSWAMVLASYPEAATAAVLPPLVMAPMRAT